MAAIGISEMLCEVIRSESEYKQLYNTLYKFISGGSRFSQGPSLITGLSDGARNVLCASLAVCIFGKRVCVSGAGLQFL